MKREPQHLVSVAVLAACFNTTARSIQRDVSAGVLPKPVKRGLYDLVAAVRRRLELVEQDGETDESTAEAKRRFWNARAQREELAAEREGNELVPFDEIREFVMEAFRAAFLTYDAVARRCAHELAGIGDAAVLYRRLHGELRSGGWAESVRRMRELLKRYGKGGDIDDQPPAATP